MKRSFFREVGRKGLDEIVKLAKMERLPPREIAQLWLAGHDFVQYHGKVMSAAAYTALEPRLLRNPHFVVPVFRESGLFNVVIQNQRELSLVTPLGEWQEKGDDCQVHLTIQFFTELMRTKGIVLTRTEIKDTVLNKQDATHVTNTFLRYYTIPSCYQFVEDFNHSPHQFDYHRYLRHMKEDAKEWSSVKALHCIDIEDKRFNWKDAVW